MQFKKVLAYGVILLSVGVLLGVQLGAFLGEDDTYASMKMLEDAFLRITGQYVEEVDSADLAETAIGGMLTQLDPHTVYITPERMRQVREDFDASFEGIGISYEFVAGPEERDTLAVLTVLPGGPSEEAGLLSGDRIVAIDGEPAVGIDAEQVQQSLKGPRGTEVDLELRRPGFDEPIGVTITRDRIPLTTVDATHMVDERTGYIKLNRFARTTHSEFVEALRTLKRKGMERLVLDLRGNAGGFMDMAIRVSDEFLGGDQLIVSARSRHRAFNQESRASRTGLFEDGPLIVLVDEQSASASEIVAGALQDHDRAMIVGRRTFGKGLVQKQYELDDGSALRVTISRFYTPTGRLIQTPYAPGHRDEYYEHKRDRVEQHAATEPADLPDSLRYRTDAGRVVYGGGGIMPDEVVDDDTLSAFMRVVSGRQLVSGYVRRWIDTHGPSFREAWKGDTEAFVHSFVVDDAMFDDFMAYAADRGVIVGDRRPAELPAKARRFTNEDVAADLPMLRVLIKAHLGRRIVDRAVWYPVFQEVDPVFQQAMRLWDPAGELAGHYAEALD